MSNLLKVPVSVFSISQIIVFISKIPFESFKKSSMSLPYTLDMWAVVKVAI